MTITNSNRRVSYTVSGGATVFAYTWRITSTDDLKVVVRTTAGVETTQALTANYTVSGVGSASGGNVTFGTTPGNGNYVSIMLNTPLTQSIDYQESGAFSAEAHEEALDKLTNQSKRSRDLAERSLTLTDGSVLGTNSSYDVASSKIVNLTAGTAGADGVNKTQLDAVQTQVTSNDSDIAALQATTGHGTSGNSALNTRLATAEASLTTVASERDAAFYMHSGGTQHVFNSGTATLVPFGSTAVGGSAASGGQYTTPFAGLWFVSVSLTPDHSAITVNDVWIISIGYSGATGANRTWFEVAGDPDKATVTFSTMINLGAGVAVGAYVKRSSGSGNFTLNASGSDNQIAGICIHKD